MSLSLDKVCAGGGGGEGTGSGSWFQEPRSCWMWGLPTGLPILPAQPVDSNSDPSSVFLRTNAKG